MSLYQCDECGCRENTACGWYWLRNMPKMTKPEQLGKALCSACAPTEYPDGSKTEFNGKWHGKFRRMFLPKGMFITNRQGNLAHKETGDTDLGKYEIQNT